MDPGRLPGAAAVWAEGEPESDAPGGGTACAKARKEDEAWLSAGSELSTERVDSGWERTTVVGRARS